MTVVNKLKSVLKTQGISNPNQLKIATKRADPLGKGVAQATALSAWNDPYWVPNSQTLQMICRTFDIQPGDFLFYIDDENAVQEFLEEFEAEELAEWKERKRKARSS